MCCEGLEEKKRNSELGSLNFSIVFQRYHS